MSEADMTDEQLKIAVCEASGWKRIDVNNWINGNLPEEDQQYEDLPALTLDFMHELEKEPTPAQMLLYGKELARVVLEGREPTEDGKVNWFWMAAKYAHATARQRAVAWLLTINSRK